MAAGNSTKPSKPPLPYPEYPLRRHATGRWHKYAKSKMWYFTGSAEEALAKWLAVRQSSLDECQWRVAQCETLMEDVTCELANRLARASPSVSLWRLVGATSQHCAGRLATLFQPVALLLGDGMHADRCRLSS